MNVRPAAVALAVALSLTATHAQAPPPSSGARPLSSQAFRLTYTFTETDGGRKIGVQHYSIVVTEGGRTTLKNGSKVPVATGSYTVASGAQTQFTYLDVGTNLDTNLESPVDGVWRVRAKVEQSSVSEEKSVGGVNEPIVRQSVLDVSTALSLGKTQLLGTLDFSGSTRHLDVEIVMEALK